MIPRETLVTQSVQDYVEAGLIARGYPLQRDLGAIAIAEGATYDAATRVVLMDSFPFGRFEGALDLNYVAAGFNFDDGGNQAELGSSLKNRQYTIEHFCFGKTATWAENLASAIVSVIDSDAVIPLKDIGGTGAVIDALIIEPGGAAARRVTVREPRPWEENISLVQVKVLDEYYG